MATSNTYLLDFFGAMGTMYYSPEIFKDFQVKANTKSPN